LLGTVFGPKRDEIIGDWRKLHNEDLHNFYSLPCNIRMVKRRKMKWARYVARMGVEYIKSIGIKA
jgi:hypothetical protein